MGENLRGLDEVFFRYLYPFGLFRYCGWMRAMGENLRGLDKVFFVAILAYCLRECVQ